jgi:WD40 repeat protein
LALSADGLSLATGSVDGTVKLWDVPRHACLHSLHHDRPLERTDITDLTGVSTADRALSNGLSRHEAAGAPTPELPYVAAPPRRGRPSLTPCQIRVG